jgi:hypothetical protein
LRQTRERLINYLKNPISDMDPQTFDDKLIDALWASLHSTHTPNSEVLEGDGVRIDKGSKRRSSVYRYISAITGNPVFKQIGGVTFYLHGDPETIRWVHEQVDMTDMRPKMKAQHEGRETYEKNGKEYNAGHAPVGTTSEERWAYWAAKWGFETECSLSPPSDTGLSLDDLLSRRGEVPVHEWRPKEEGEEIAQDVQTSIREELSGFDHAGRVRVEFSTSYHGQGFTLWAGQAAWSIGGRNESTEEVLSNAKEILESQGVRHWADPAPSKGSTGEPYFQERG